MPFSPKLSVPPPIVEALLQIEAPPPIAEMLLPNVETPLRIAEALLQCMAATKTVFRTQADKKT